MVESTNILQSLGFRWLSAAVTNSVGIGIILAKVDGAYLAGVGTILSAIVTLVLGLLAYYKGQAKVAKDAEAWRLLAESRERELELERKLHDE